MELLLQLMTHGLLWNRWFLDPALKGRYPDGVDSTRLYARMGVEPEDLKLTRADFDFIGVNVYSRLVVRHSGSEPKFLGFFCDGQSGEDGPKTDMGLEVWPKAMYTAVMEIKRAYGPYPIEITENGGAFNETPDAEGRIDDGRRIDFHREYLIELARAIDDGADVRSYHVWSLMDNLEWTYGFRHRFGLVFVDFETLARSIKSSGYWYARVARTNEVRS